MGNKRLFIPTVLSLIFLMALPANVKGQITLLDSLKRNINNANNEEDKLNAIMDLCNNWESFNMDTLHQYALIVNSMANKQKNKKASLFSQYYLAVWLYQKNRLDTALGKTNSLIAIARKMPYGEIDTRLYRLRSNILNRGNKINEMANNCFELLYLAEENSDTVGMISAKSAIGIANMKLKKFQESLYWHRQALALMRRDYYRKKMCFAYLNMSVAFTDGPIKQLDSASFYIKECIKNAKESNKLVIECNAENMYGNILSQQGKIKEAEDALKRGINLDQQIGDTYLTTFGMQMLSNFYITNKEPQKAIPLCLEGIDSLKKHGGQFQELSMLYGDLALVYKSLGNYKQAYETIFKQEELNDSIYSANPKEAIAELQTKYDVQKKENTILQQKYDLNKENMIVYGLIGFLVLLSTTGMLLFKNRQRQQKIKLEQLEMSKTMEMQKAVELAKEEERNRIITDLHDDVGGGLSTIRMVSDLIKEQKEDTLQLEKYAHKISDITKEVSQRMNTIVWALTAENDSLQNLLNYIRNYGFRFFEDTKIKFDCDLPSSMANVPISGLKRKNIFLCAKEAMNNIYKHSGANKAWVNLSLEEGLLFIRINDNGKGFTNKNPLGNGLKNIQKRMKEINGDANYNRSDFTSVVLTLSLSSS